MLICTVSSCFGIVKYWNLLLDNFSELFFLSDTFGDVQGRTMVKSLTLFVNIYSATSGSNLRVDFKSSLHLRSPLSLPTLSCIPFIPNLVEVAILSVDLNLQLVTHLPQTSHNVMSNLPEGTGLRIPDHGWPATGTKNSHVALRMPRQVCCRSYDHLTG